MRLYFGASGTFYPIIFLSSKGTAYAPNSKGGWYIKAYYKGTIYAF